MREAEMEGKALIFSPSGPRLPLPRQEGQLPSLVWVVCCLVTQTEPPPRCCGLALIFDRAESVLLAGPPEKTMSKEPKWHLLLYLLRRGGAGGGAPGVGLLLILISPRSHLPRSTPTPGTLWPGSSSSTVVGRARFPWRWPLGRGGMFADVGGRRGGPMTERKGFPLPLALSLFPLPLSQQRPLGCFLFNPARFITTREALQRAGGVNTRLCNVI